MDLTKPIRFLYLNCLGWLIVLAACASDGQSRDDGPIHIKGVTVLPQNLVPFTTELREEFQLSDEDLRRIQFYVSNDITLQATRVSGERAVAGGKLRRRGQTLVEEVFIAARTMCGAIENDERSVSVTFNPSFKNRLLTFGDDGKSGGRYMLFAKRWENDVGQLVYGGNEFAAVERSDLAHLLVGKDELETLKKRREVEPGYRVPE